MAMHTAQVFDTVELLESILVKLPTRDLLFAQRVCKRWQDTIQDSCVLRRALFLEPMRTGLLYCHFGGPLNPTVQPRGSGGWLANTDQETAL